MKFDAMAGWLYFVLALAPGGIVFLYIFFCCPAYSLGLYVYKLK